MQATSPVVSEVLQLPPLTCSSSSSGQRPRLSAARQVQAIKLICVHSMQRTLPGPLSSMHLLLAVSCYLCSILQGIGCAVRKACFGSSCNNVHAYV